MKRIAVLTSGGDAPGMNAAIRAVTRVGIDRGLEIFGVRDGFHGLVDGNLIPLDARSVGGILTTGGTMLGSSRYPEFKNESVQKEALQRLRNNEISGLIVIGGNGSQAGAAALSGLGFPVVGIASTIDNDLYGSEMTIGVDTALNIALESIRPLAGDGPVTQTCVLCGSHGSRLRVFGTALRNCRRRGSRRNSGGGDLPGSGS